MQANEEVSEEVSEEVNEEVSNEEVNEGGKIIFPPGTMAVQMDAAVTLAPGYAGVDLSRLEIKAGDILFLVPVDGRYCHIAEDGRLVIDGELRGHMRDLRPKK